VSWQHFLSYFFFYYVHEDGFRRCNELGSFEMITSNK